jgi:hypothetical protein
MLRIKQETSHKISVGHCFYLHLNKFENSGSALIVVLTLHFHNVSDSINIGFNFFKSDDFRVPIQTI